MLSQQLPDPKQLSRRFRRTLKFSERFGRWTTDYEVLCSRGGAHLHISGPHVYDNRENWTAGLELHSLAPLEDRPPDHMECFLLKAPCWHDGTSMYAQEKFLPLVMRDDHATVFHLMESWLLSHLYHEESAALSPQTKQEEK